MTRKPSIETQIKQFKILTDTREQSPYRFPCSIGYTLPYGDYTIEYNGRPYYDKICVERKGGVSEIYSATGSGRDRWERELLKLSKVEIKLVLCEFSYMDLVNKQPYGKLQPSSVYGSIANWNAVFGIPFIFCGNKTNARNYLYKLFFSYIKHKILGL